MRKNEDVAAIIEDVLLGNIRDRNQFKLRIQNLDFVPSPMLSGELHQAGHFIDDGDLRHRDTAYAETQTSKLKAAIQRLRRG